MIQDYISSFITVSLIAISVHCKDMMALSVDHNICVLQKQNELDAASDLTSNHFERFFSDPLLFLSKLYSTVTSQAAREGHSPPVESDDVSFGGLCSGTWALALSPFHSLTLLLLSLAGGGGVPVSFQPRDSSSPVPSA